ncbi:insecticidal toxin complex protein TccC [Pseudomonas sp. B10]|uniref:RHS repeat-associated core domain-containing protein n=1 Tax=Pseudomonas sp. B10 TaxID=118613 RepID=UPI0009538BB3|nr:RHS repeat-associated core domain-containing protein [Pseudomonas sp. B10]SIR23156.1 insecticidal toxin complex protein TccC [Pseudomonas sp. B10]
MSKHAQTPHLSVNDARGLPVRQVAYWREDGSESEARITAVQHDVAGRRVAQRDPRLFADASAPANLGTVYSLTGQVLITLSVDAGWRVSLWGEARQPLHGWDGRGSVRCIEYDEQLRPLAVFEHADDGEPLCTERYGYAGSNPTFATRNQCGQIIRLDDPAGTQLFEQFGLTGGIIAQSRRFLRSLDPPDWPVSLSERDKLLEDAPAATSYSRFNPLSETIEQIDARGHRQLFSQTLDGQLRDVRLQLMGSAPKTLVGAIQYDAQGHTLRETADNGVITTLDYAAEDGRLISLQSQRGNDILQDLRYVYDPVGNVLSIEDAALPIRYFANQRIEPVNRYRYDSLDQLIEATGWEAGQTSKFSLADPAAIANYTQTYHYDCGGNLLELIHDGPQGHGHRLVAAKHSNRCLPVRDGLDPGEEDLRNGFDANGNLLGLQPGQTFNWDLRNRLREVRLVLREDRSADNEQYRYAADGMRVRKVRLMQTNAKTLMNEVRYLPNLQIRTHSGTGEILQVISVQAGRSSVQVLHWESEPPQGIDNDQARYSLNDHLGSCTLELDATGKLISQERYHPFGTTAWFAGRSEIETSYKTLRYSGKERDATGLYYYGFRYYVAGWQRWLNPDPSGAIDGLNLFSMVKGNPLAYFDTDGRIREGVNEEYPTQATIGSSPSPQSSTPFSANSVINESTRFGFPDTPPLSPEVASASHSIEVLMEKVQLTDSSLKNKPTSIADDIGGRPAIGGGGEGEIYESADGKHVYKKFRGADKRNSIPGYVKTEAEVFNAYYGAGSATALIEDNQSYLKMIKLDGIPLGDIKKGSIPASGANALLEMFNEMEAKDLYHQDVQDHNFLWSEKDTKVYPVDMEAHPFELAQYSIDVYDRKKTTLLKQFANNVKR